MQDRFVYTPDFETKIEKALSKSRLDAYRAILPTTAQFMDVIRVYNANTSISEALVGSLQIMEISIRNSIHSRFKESFGSEWYLANRIGLDAQGEGIVRKTVNKYKNVVKYDTPDKLSEKVVSEMTLGFWSNLFHRKYEDPLWRKHLRYAFPHVGGPLTRGQIFILIDNMRRLRNRISHHEQIIKYDLDKYYNNVIDLVSWVSPVMAIWLSHHNRFYEVKEQYRDELSLIIQ